MRLSSKTLEDSHAGQGTLFAHLLSSHNNIGIQFAWQTDQGLVRSHAKNIVYR